MRDAVMPALRVCAMQTHTFKLGVGDTAPFAPAVANAGTTHHVTQNIVPLVPLVSDSVHYPFAGCAHFLVSYGKEDKSGYELTLCWVFGQTPETNCLGTFQSRVFVR